MFSGLAAHRLFGANFAFDGRTSSGEGMLVSGSYFPTLGLRPALGRLLAPGDDPAVGEARVVVLELRRLARLASAPTPPSSAAV